MEPLEDVLRLLEQSRVGQLLEQRLGDALECGDQPAEALLQEMPDGISRDILVVCRRERLQNVGSRRNAGPDGVDVLLKGARRGIVAARGAEESGADGGVAATTELAAELLAHRVCGIDRKH